MPTPPSEKSIFLHAAGLDSVADRRAYLDEVCRGDAHLRGEVEALLAAHDRLGGATPAASGVETSIPAPGTTARLAPHPEAGVVVAGRYKLLEVIGEGGMGEVWMAEQTEPVRRQVALKLIKPGMDSKAVLTRFEAERQALAMMDHPNIAKVLDAGTTPDGRPFFVMELVKGVPITAYCDDHQLTPRERLGLFVPVCNAIQHAHQKGVIHRDIKPNNVLVALYDGQPVPKVIDFGVAKATAQPLTEQTLHTGFGTVVGTVEYMSPEQASFNQLDVDTRSDVYSLGVLLYELLSGTTPLERKRLKATPLLDALRAVREEDTVRPSARLSTVEKLPAIAAHRRTEPRRLVALVRGELDWIVMRALEKDRSRRYETADALAADVQRYLADAPVLACPPSVGYRLRKWARRHRPLVGATALSVAAMVAALAAVTWQWRVAVRALEDKGRALEDTEVARKAAQDQREQTEANWATSLISLADRDWVLGDLVKARQTLGRCPEKYRNDEWRRLHWQCHAEIKSFQTQRNLGAIGVTRFSPDGRGIVVRGLRQFLWYDADDYSESVLCDLPAGMGTGLGAVVGANGAELTVTFLKMANPMSLGSRVSTRDYSVAVWDLRAMRWLVQSETWTGTSATLDRNGRLVAVANGEDVTVREVNSGKTLGRFTVPGLGMLRAISPDGRFLAEGRQKAVVLWDIAAGRPVQEIPAETPNSAPMFFSPNGRHLVFAAEYKAGVVGWAVWDVHEGRLVARLGPPRLIECQDFSHDNHFIALGVSGGLIEVWDFARSRRVVTFRGHPPSGRVGVVRFHPTGRRLLSIAEDGWAKVWDLRPLYEHPEGSDAR